MGYQGWFNCPGDGTTVGWWHWFTGNRSDGQQSAECRRLSSGAAVRHYHARRRRKSREPFQRCESGDGAETQFAWMKQAPAGRRRAARFAVDLFIVTLAARNIVLAMFARRRMYMPCSFVMYDLTGLTRANLISVAQDWENLEQGGVTKLLIYAIADIRCSRSGVQPLARR